MAIGLVIERGQLGLGAAAANQHHDVEVVVAGQRAQSTPQTMSTAHSPCTRTSMTAQAERQAAAVELVGEVAPGRAGRAGDHADAQRRGRHTDASVGIEQAAGDQPAHDVVALAAPSRRA